MPCDWPPQASRRSTSDRVRFGPPPSPGPQAVYNVRPPGGAQCTVWGPGVYTAPSWEGANCTRPERGLCLPPRIAHRPLPRMTEIVHSQTKVRGALYRHATTAPLGFCRNTFLHLKHVFAFLNASCIGMPKTAPFGTSFLRLHYWLAVLRSVITSFTCANAQIRELGVRYA